MVVVVGARARFVAGIPRRRGCRPATVQRDIEQNRKLPTERALHPEIPDRSSPPGGGDAGSRSEFQSGGPHANSVLLPWIRMRTSSPSQSRYGGSACLVAVSVSARLSLSRVPCLSARLSTRLSFLFPSLAGHPSVK